MLVCGLNHRAYVAQALWPKAVVHGRPAAPGMAPITRLSEVAYNEWGSLLCIAKLWVRCSRAVCVCGINPLGVSYLAALGARQTRRGSSSSSSSSWTAATASISAQERAREQKLAQTWQLQQQQLDRGRRRSRTAAAAPCLRQQEWRQCISNSTVEGCVNMS